MCIAAYTPYCQPQRKSDDVTNHRTQAWIHVELQLEDSGDDLFANHNERHLELLFCVFVLLEQRIDFVVVVGRHRHRHGKRGCASVMYQCMR